MQFLSSRLTRGGFACSLAAPDHLRWAGRGAELLTLAQDRKVDGILRFFPAEWLPALPRAASWRNYCENGLLACNPVQAVLVQSKRCPLIWDRLGVAIPMWRSLLPDTRDPRDAPWQRDADWLLKPAFGRVGEGLAWRGGVPPRIWRKTSWAARLFPRHWIAQRRFASRPLASRNGDRHLCIGVFTVDGKAAGFYGRLSARTTIEKHAQDIAVLIQETVSCR